MSGSFVEDTLAQASKAGGRAGIRVFEAILCCNHDRVVDLDVAVHLASFLARRSLPTAGGETVERLGARAVEGGATPLTLVAELLTKEHPGKAYARAGNYSWRW